MVDKSADYQNLLGEGMGLDEILCAQDLFFIDTDHAHTLHCK